MMAALWFVLGGAFAIGGMWLYAVIEDRRKPTPTGKWEKVPTAWYWKSEPQPGVVMKVETGINEGWYKGEIHINGIYKGVEVARTEEEAKVKIEKKLREVAAEAKRTAILIEHGKERLDAEEELGL